MDQLKKLGKFVKLFMYYRGRIRLHVNFKNSQKHAMNHDEHTQQGFGVFTSICSELV